MRRKCIKEMYKCIKRLILSFNNLEPLVDKTLFLLIQLPHYLTESLLSKILFQ